ncbi:hypothetical protein YB2330_006358 [Saitoella coloradoensis]
MGEVRRRQPPAAGQDDSNDIITEASHAVEDAASKVKQALIIAWDDLEHWQHDNKYITGGYRRTAASFRACFASLFYLHNESVNIWSHLLGSLLFTVIALFYSGYLLPAYESAGKADTIVFSAFFLGAVVCLGLSATYHTLSCHSPHINKFGNKLDYIGIVFLIVGSFYPSIYYGFYCHPHLQELYVGMITVLGACVVCFTWMERFRTPGWRPWRAGMFSALGLSAAFPVGHALLTRTYAELAQTMGLGYLLLQGFLYLLGAAIYAARVPEKWSPGIWIFGSSHQIFHGLVVAAAIAHFRGLIIAYEYWHGVRDGQCSI